MGSSIKKIMGVDFSSCKTIIGKLLISSSGITNGKSLLHFNGTNGSTTFTDSFGKTWTAYGDAQLSTSSPKFGTASGLFDGTGDYIGTPDHSDFKPSGSFAVAMWVKVSSDSNFHLLFVSGNENGGFAYGIAIFLNSGAGARVWMYGGSGYSDVRVQDTTTTVKDGSWHHIEVDYDSGSGYLYIFIDGNNTSGYVGRAAQFHSTNYVKIGDYYLDGANHYYLNGNMDEFVFINGSTLHTANFTPPTNPYDSPAYPEVKSVVGLLTG